MPLYAYRLEKVIGKFWQVQKGTAKAIDKLWQVQEVTAKN
jgi:hypothetical protein